MISAKPYWLKEEAKQYIAANKRQTLMSLSFRFTIKFSVLIEYQAGIFMSFGIPVFFLEVLEWPVIVGMYDRNDSLSKFSYSLCSDCHLRRRAVMPLMDVSRPNAMA